MAQRNWIRNVKYPNRILDIRNVSSKPKSKTKVRFSQWSFSRSINWTYSWCTLSSTSDIFNNWQVHKILNTQKLCCVIQRGRIIYWTNSVYSIIFDELSRHTVTIIFEWSFPINIRFFQFNLLRSIVEIIISKKYKRVENFPIDINRLNILTLAFVTYIELDQALPC